MNEKRIIIIPIMLIVKEIIFLIPKLCKLTIKDRQIFGRFIKTIVKGISSKNVLP
jgi:hypothetical protein